MTYLDHLEEWLIAFLIAAATLLIFVAVTHRYALDMAAKFQLAAVYDALFKINLSWAQELCIYMFVWMAKFGAAYGVRTGIHVGVDVLVNNLPEKLRMRFILFSLFAGAFFTAVIGTFGGRLFLPVGHTPQNAPDLDKPFGTRVLPNHPWPALLRLLCLAFAWST